MIYKKNIVHLAYMVFIHVNNLPPQSFMLWRLQTIQNWINEGAKKYILTLAIIIVAK